MANREERRDLGIATVGGEEILAQVVGADAEEINLSAKLVKNESDGWHFDHDANFDVGLKRDAILRTDAACASRPRLELHDFFDDWRSSAP